MQEGEEPVELPIDGTLDLHVFRPRDVPSVVEAYLEACLARGIMTVRIIHGKGIGVQRERVHATLKRLPAISSWHLADASGGTWGATIVYLAGPTSPS